MGRKPAWIWSVAICEQLFCDQKSFLFIWRYPGRIAPLLWVIAIAALAGRLQGYALSLAGLRRQVNSHLRRAIGFLRTGLGDPPIVVAYPTAKLMAWLPSPLQALELCSPSRKAQQKQVQAWLSRIELAPRSRSAALSAPHLIVV